MTMLIRLALASDAPALAHIRNWAAEESTALFDDTPVTVANRTRWLAEEPVVFVADVDGEVIGYASYGPFRTLTGYRHTVENSVYVLPGNQGAGIGTGLLQTLIAHAEANPDVHRMVAWIESTNEASLTLHRRHGFEEKGRLTEVGYKCGRWLDVTILERAC